MCRVSSCVSGVIPWQYAALCSYVVQTVLCYSFVGNVFCEVLREAAKLSSCLTQRISTKPKPGTIAVSLKTAEQFFETIVVYCDVLRMCTCMFACVHTDIWCTVCVYIYIQYSYIYWYTTSYVNIHKSSNPRWYQFFLGHLETQATKGSFCRWVYQMFNCIGGSMQTFAIYSAWLSIILQ